MKRIILRIGFLAITKKEEKIREDTDAIIIHFVVNFKPRWWWDIYQKGNLKEKKKLNRKICCGSHNGT